MGRPKASVTWPEVHERYNRSHPLLRELVSVCAFANGVPFFTTLLTRVPGLGEEIAHEDKYYRVARVQHEPVDDDGRTRAGYHAFVEVLLPDEDAESIMAELHAPKRKQKRRRSAPRERKPSVAKPALP